VVGVDLVAPGALERFVRNKITKEVTVSHRRISAAFVAP